VLLLARLHRAQSDFYAGGTDVDVRALFQPDIAWHVPGTSPIAGDYHGLDQVLAYFTHRRDLAHCTMTMHPRELLVGDGAHIASVTDGTATIGAIEHSWSTVGLYRVVDGRIAECWLLPLDPVAYDLAWSTTD
jgi:ketosteroid isomerase-like protein